MLWYLSRAGQVLGPFDADTLHARIDAGELGGNDLLAQPGDPTWQSVAQVFPARFPGPGPRARALVGGLALVAAAGCWVAYAGLGAIAWRVADSEEALGLSVLVMAACAGLLLLAVAAFAWVRWRGGGSIGPGVKVVAGISALVALPALAMGTLVFRTTVASDLEVDPHHLSINDKGEVLLLGGLGRTLAHDLQVLLESHTGELVLVLDNGGGIIDAAAAAADLLRARGPFTARVDGECASACTLLLAAADRIELYTDSRIGLHRPSNVLGGERGIDSDGTIKTMVEHLERAGFGPQALDAMRDTPPDDMAWLEPTTHFGVLPDFLLLDNDSQAVPAEARGTVLARALLARDMPEAAEMLDFFELAFPDHVRLHSDALLLAQTRQEGVEEALRQLLHGPFGTALAATPPHVARAWLRNLVKLDEQFEWESPGGACYAQALHPKAERAALARAVEVVRAAAERDWAPWQATSTLAASEPAIALPPLRPWPIAYSAQGPEADENCAGLLGTARSLAALPDHRLGAALLAELQ
ncbi:GYF domain-containing protein [Alkalisalibacterium limincola]|uniref:GYF domain-containing protein n=1 Tax=Alkalisalibacterium limincola TaxID=2699169 RepID=A0A5C8KJS7_9GAMM|nr:GYF domain-containing protein [Alkalisalibacterium limincola]TXK59644.1 hypothetical protein FU658_13450 [Alkalisalibacterium limincola]